jgi:hypothetical protein
MAYTEEILRDIYRIQHDRFQQSRNNQWKINITFWTLIVLAIYNKDKLPLHNNFTAILICFILLILHLVFVIIVQRNLETDKKIWVSILKYWNNELPKNEEFRIDIQGVKISDLKGRPWFWIVFQMAFTLVLLLVFVFL